MQFSASAYALYPVSCPSCRQPMNLVVGGSMTVSVVIHNIPSCNVMFYYRCWQEAGCPLPRIEFLEPENARTLIRASGEEAYPTRVMPKYRHTQRRARARSR